MSTSVLDRRSTGPQKPVAVVDSRSAEPKRLYTAQEYLALEREAEFKSEFYRGEIITMPGVSKNHGRINRNLVTRLSLLLEETKFELFFCDLKVRTPSSDSYNYPDVVVCHIQPVSEDSVQDTILNPSLVVEILSPSTERIDRGRKFDSYRMIDSLQEYLLLSQDSIRAELHTRQPDDTWSLTVFEGADGILELTIPQVKIPLAKVYKGTVLPSETRSGLSGEKES